MRSLGMPGPSAVLVALFLAVLVPASPSTAAERVADSSSVNRHPPSSSSLLLLAQQLIAAQNQRLISPEAAPPASLVTNTPASEYFAVNDSRRLALAAHGLRYTIADTAFSNGSVDVDGMTARVNLTENTTLALAYTNGDTALLPDYRYERTHELEFHYDRGTWTLTTQAPLEDFPLAASSDGPVDVAAFNIQADDERMESEFSPRLEALATGTTTLNRSGIVGYAYAFVGTYQHTSRTEGYNSQYRIFTQNDCTNFVSQALRYAGWTEVTGFYQSDGAWWYNYYLPIQTYSWGGAQNWSNFVSRSGRGYLTDSVRNLQRGDILQADWNNDGIADHTMIVTKRDAQGNIFLTYHSVNEQDRSFWDIDAQQKKAHPQLTYRRWRLRDQFN